VEKVLDSMPMMRAWVMVEMSKDPNCEGDVWEGGSGEVHE